MYYYPARKVVLAHEVAAIEPIVVDAPKRHFDMLTDIAQRMLDVVVTETLELYREEVDRYEFLDDKLVIKRYGTKKVTLLVEQEPLFHWPPGRFQARLGLEPFRLGLLFWGP